MRAREFGTQTIALLTLFLYIKFTRTWFAVVMIGNAVPLRGA